MQNPFTTTFSKIPDYTYIPTSQTEEIIENFSYDVPSESVYKITGVRGSGKTVLLAKIEEEFGTIEPFIKKKKSGTGLTVSANILGSGAGTGISEQKSEKIFDIGAELDRLLKEAAGQKKKIMIGVDEVSKTPDMVVFASEFGKWLRAGYPVYLVCTGLYENIEQLSNVKNLTFFRRASTVKTEALNSVRMSEMYKSRLNIGIDLAKKLSAVTKGYAYAFQELGILWFRKKSSDGTEDIIESLKTELFAYSYEKIWAELTEADREMARLLTDKEEYKRSEITALMDKPGNYSVYRDRLLRRGIINARQAYISLALPFFNDYIKEYCS